MRFPVQYRSLDKRKSVATVWRRLRDMVYHYRFAIAVAIPAPGRPEEYAKEYLASVAEQSCDSCAIIFNPDRTEKVGLGQLLSGEDFPLGRLVAARFEVASEEEETFLAAQMHKAPARNFVVVNSPRPYLWDWLSGRIPFSLVYFIETSLSGAYLDQGFFLLRFDPAKDCPVFNPLR
ncbi:MAG: hypothetical protein ACPLRW_07545 [Moorellales bacterium]